MALTTDSQQMDRLERLRGRLRQRELDAIIVSARTNVGYISGFTGSAGVLLVGAEPEENYLLTDGRYTEQAGSEASAFEVITTNRWVQELPGLLPADALGDGPLPKVGFESEHTTHKQWRQLVEALGDVVELVPTEDVVEQMRQCKSSAELQMIRRAAQITDQAFSTIGKILRPGRTEKEVALDLEVYMRSQGASGVSFPVIVAGGARSALPHAQPSDRVLQEGDLVVMDFGCVVEGYCSDFTRTVVLGEALPWQREVYDVVLRAQEAALKAARPGITGKELDAVAREIITEAGYGERFGHGLGHGVGLEVHESPAVSPRGETPLTEGMVITIEPGVYLPGKGGVRIEDLVFITSEGCEVLSQGAKSLAI